MAKARSTWGSKRKRGEESWELRYPVDGKPRSETFRGTAKEADRRLAELRIKYEGASPDMTLDSFWKAVFEPEMPKRLAASTIPEYKRTYEKTIKPTFGDTPINDIQPRIIQSWLQEMTNGKAKAAKRILSSILGRAFALGYTDDNVAQRRYAYPTRRAKGQRSKAVFTLDEMLQVFCECEGEIWEAAFILAAFGGAQLGEAMSPKLEEISMVDGYAIVPITRSVQRLDREVKILPKPKNEYRERNIVIPPPQSDRLMKLVEQGKEQGEVWLTDNGFGFPSDPNLISKTYERWFRDRQIRYVPFGNLRNSYGTVLESLGMDGLMASKMMGHSQPTTYYKHYLRPQTADKIEALRKTYGQ